MRLQLVLAAVAALTSANVNLFISKEEMNRTLGLTAVLRYVEAGKVNAYAVDYPVLVRPNISHLTFLWSSDAQYQIPYTISIDIPEDGQGSLEAGLNVPSEGFVPQTLSPLVVRLECSGATRQGGEVSVGIHLEYGWPSEAAPTRLRLKRRKICRPRRPRSNLQEVDALGDLSDEPRVVAANYPGRAVEVFYIAMGCVVGFVIVVASLIIAYFLRLKHPMHQPQTVMTSPGCASQAQPFLRPQCQSPSELSKISMEQSSLYAKAGPPARSGSSVYASQRSLPPPSPAPVPVRPPVHLPTALEELAVDPTRLHIADVVQEGTFGEILSGLLLSRSADAPATSALLKSVKRGASQQQRHDFLLEGLRFHGTPGHPHVSRVVALAVLAEEEEAGRRLEAPVLCYALGGFLNLKRFLLGSSSAQDHVSSQTLRTQDIVYLGLQLIRGVQHLHRHGILHKDLAARNCLISGDLQLVVQDTALSRDLFPLDYHCLGDNENRPVKWLALEALHSHRFTSASDVWSFGVTLWELMSGGWQPYSAPEVDADEVGATLDQGYRLPQPYNCPDELYGVMFCCWGQHPQSRPTFDQLLVALNDFYAQLTEYI